MIRVDRKLNSTDVVDALTDLFIFQKSGLKPPTSVGKDPTVRRRRSKPLNPSTLVGGGSDLFQRHSSQTVSTYSVLTDTQVALLFKGKDSVFHNLLFLCLLIGMRSAETCGLLGGILSARGTSGGLFK